ncbi:MAG: hypothetical protein ACNYZG_13305, partial [Gammaproteobacteria bacterium]
EPPRMGSRRVSARCLLFMLVVNNGFRHRQLAPRHELWDNRGQNPMFYLSQSLQAWNSDAFKNVLKKELCSINSNLLPLQQGLTQSSYAIGKNLSASVLRVESENNYIIVKAGLFYTGVIAGCNCADDPTPIDEINEYCDVLLRINKKTAETTVTLID